MNYEDILKTGDAKKNFIKGLIRLAKVDGIIDQEESQYFMSAAYALGLNSEQVAEVNNCIMSSNIINVEFDSTEEKILFFREGIQLCAIDESYDENERAEIRVMAAQMNISEDTIRSIETWVDEGMAWKKQGDELIVQYSK